MTAFNYIALDQTGKEQKGVLESDGPKQVREQLRERNLIPLTVTVIAEKNRNKKTGFHFSLQRKLKVKELSLITRQLATLLSAGMPIAESLQTLAEQAEKPYIKKYILGVHASVQEGLSLAAGMEKFPHAFPMLYRTTIAAGEHSGKLEKVLERLADFTEKQYYARQKVQHALIYPTLMACISIAILSFLLTYVVPRMISVFNQIGQNLPAATKILLSVSSFVRNDGLYLIIAIIIGIIAFNRGLKNSAFKNRVHKLLLRLPIFGSAIKTINTARFSRSFGILSSATVPVLEAMRASNKLVTNLPIQQAIETAIIKVSEGENISTALKQTSYFPAMSIHLIASGETSGQLENMLERAAENQDRDVAIVIDNFITLFEPALIIFMGAIVLFIVLAILLPIFTLDQFAG